MGMPSEEASDRSVSVRVSSRYPNYTSPCCMPQTPELDDNSQVVGEYSANLARGNISLREVGNKRKRSYTVAHCHWRQQGSCSPMTIKGDALWGAPPLDFIVGMICLPESRLPSLWPGHVPSPL